MYNSSEAINIIYDETENNCDGDVISGLCTMKLLLKDTSNKGHLSFVIERLSVLFKR